MATNHKFDGVNARVIEDDNEVDPLGIMRMRRVGVEIDGRNIWVGSLDYEPSDPNFDVDDLRFLAYEIVNRWKAHDETNA